MPEGAGKAEAAGMVQTMLKERFALKYHRESRDLPVALIVVGKRGFPLHEAVQTGHTTLESANRRDGKFHLVGTEAPLAALAKYLTFVTGRTVIDGTGLHGVYDFDIAWTPDYDPESASIDRAAASAIEQALDIRLEPQKAPARVLVIDHIAKTPSTN